MASDGEGSRYDLPLWCSVASGTVGGACAVVVGYPFETIKVRLQTGATQRMWSQLFAGMGAPLATVTPQWAVMYAAYYNVQKYLGDKELGPVARGAVSGAACGFAVSFCAVPVDVVKINAQKMHVSAYESMRTLYAQRGLRFVAHGGLATILHLTLSQMAFFATYEFVLDRWERPPAHAPAVAGGLSGLVEWTLFMATDTVKTRVQAAAPGASYVNAWRTLWRSEGPRGFYRGYGPVVLRAVPVNATSFFVIEAANRRIREFRERR